MALKFDGNTIENNNYRITDIDHYSMPNKDVPISALAFGDKSIIPWDNYPSKGIKITGYIHCDSLKSLDAHIDTLKGYLTTKDGDLDIDHDNGTRRYIATVNRVDISRTISLTSARFTIEFICSQPFGRDISLTTFGSQTNYTSSILTISGIMYGSSPRQYPVITITLDALTGSGDYIKISNDNNGQDMLLYGVNFTAGDIIVIDTFIRSVTINGVHVDYLGSFPELVSGNNSITYVDGFTTRTIDVIIQYYKRYL